jgi:hypothetical protein
MPEDPTIAGAKLEGRASLAARSGDRGTMTVRAALL